MSQDQMKAEKALAAEREMKAGNKAILLMDDVANGKCAQFHGTETRKKVIVYVRSRLPYCTPSMAGVITDILLMAGELGVAADEMLAAMKGLKQQINLIKNMSEEDRQRPGAPE